MSLLDRSPIRKSVYLQNNWISELDGLSIEDAIQYLHGYSDSSLKLDVDRDAEGHIFGVMYQREVESLSDMKKRLIAVCNHSIITIKQCITLVNDITTIKSLKNEIVLWETEQAEIEAMT